MKYISSKDNPTFKEVKKLIRSSTYRKKKDLTVAIGKKIVEDIATSSIANNIEYIITTDEHIALLFQDLPTIMLSPKLAHHIDEVFADQGILAVVKRIYIEEEKLPENGPFVVLDEVSDPLNVGTIIRTAVGLGYRAILVSPQTADPLSPKVIRYSSGYSLFIPILRAETKRIFNILKNRAIKVITTYIVENQCRSTWTGKLSDFAICLGNEGKGLSNIWKDYPDHINLTLQIQTIDSFNVAIAGGILMYILKTGGELCG